jgi:hypothetical protein
MFQRRIAHIAALAITCAVPVSLVAGEKIGPDGFISKPGSYRLHHSEQTLRIYKEKGKLNYRIVYSYPKKGLSRLLRFDEVGSMGPAEPFIDKNANWFALVEKPRARSPVAIWIFDGHDLLVQLAYDPARTSDGYPAFLYDSDSRPSIVTAAPPEVWNRLPEQFKKRFERESQSGRRAL